MSREKFLALIAAKAAEYYDEAAEHSDPQPELDPNLLADFTIWLAVEQELPGWDMLRAE